MKQQPSQRKTLEQKRANAAWMRIDQIKSESEERQKRSRGKDKGSLEKEYRSRVRSLNAMIQINGLGSTLGFLKAKSNPNEVNPNAAYLLLEHLTEWMKTREFIRTSSDLVEVEPDDSGEAEETGNSLPDTKEAKNVTNQAPHMNLEGYDGILNWIISEATTDKYRQATTECLAFGLWLRRFAEAELQSSSSTESNAVQATENENSASSEAGEGRAAKQVEGTLQHGK